MSAPVPIANEDRQKKREAEINKRLEKISKQQKVEQDAEKLAYYAMEQKQQEKSKLDERRLDRHCIAKRTTALQEFMSTASEFLKAYSGLNEVTKGVDSQYGGLVSGALSVFFQIGENKEGRESAITCVFEELTVSWIGDTGRLRLYSDAYPTSQKMKDFIKDVYLGIAELAAESAEYYSRPPYARFWQAIGRPPQLGIHRQAEEIKKALLEVVSEGNALLVRNHARQNKEWEGKLKEWEETRAQEKNDEVAQIASELGISQELADPNGMIAQCKELHANAFGKALRRKGTKQLEQISLGVLKELQLYKSTEEITESSALVLSGSNYDSYEAGSSLCWLSPVTTEIAELYQLRQGSAVTSKVLFHSPCRDEASRFSYRKEPFNICVSRFIMQILLWDDRYFWQNRQMIRHNIRDSDRLRVETLKALLQGWQGSDEVCIIIDRLDRIAIPDYITDPDEDTVSDLLELILEVVSTASCKIRLVVTVDVSGWLQVRKDADLDWRWNIWNGRHDLKRFSLFRKVDWGQPEIQAW
ncbi:MAG: hypothetical protein Q9209_000351 [Squamulea sp. 1 TL-2023]